MLMDFADPPEQDVHREAQYHNPTLSQDVRVAPLEQDLDGYADQIKDLFTSFQWKDIPVTFNIATQYLEEFPDLSISEQRIYAIYILGKVLEKGDAHFLPDHFSSALLYDMAPAFADLVIFKSTSDFLPLSYLSSESSDELLIKCGENILSTFHELDWECLTQVIRKAIFFANQFDDLHLSERKEIAKKLIDYVINETDKECLPTSFDKSIFIQISDGSIDMIMNQLLILESR